MLRPPTSAEQFTKVSVTLADVPYWYHVYSTEVHATNSAHTFSQGWGDTRFSPITDSAGQVVDTYYLASTPDGAVMESILHDVLIPGGLLDTAKLVHYHMARIEMVGSVTAVSLHSNFLEKMGLSRIDMIERMPAEYRQTRPWAQAAYRQVTDAQALVYGSRRDDSARCMMLFRQRLPPIPFRVLADDCVGNMPACRQAVIALAASLALHII
jgi:hypothetical protein